MTAVRRRRWFIALAVGAAAAAVAAVALGTVTSGQSRPLGSMASTGSTPEIDIVLSSWKRLNENGRSVQGGYAAIQFPVGVSYGMAVQQIFLAQTTGRAEVPLKVVDPLAEGVVAVVPDQATGPVIISLAAPYGYDPSRGIAYGPALRYPPGVEPSDARSAAGPWPSNARLGVPILPGCMTVTTPEQPAVDCRSDEDVQLNEAVTRSVDLP